MGWELKIYNSIMSPSATPISPMPKETQKSIDEAPVYAWGPFRACSLEVRVGAKNV